MSSAMAGDRHWAQLLDAASHGDPAASAARRPCGGALKLITEAQCSCLFAQASRGPAVALAGRAFMAIRPGQSAERENQLNSQLGAHQQLPHPLDNPQWAVR